MYQDCIEVERLKFTFVFAYDVAKRKRDMGKIYYGILYTVEEVITAKKSACLWVKHQLPFRIAIIRNCKSTEVTSSKVSLRAKTTFAMFFGH